MFQKFFILARHAARAAIAPHAPLAATTEAGCERWLRDPLSHPTLDAMSLSELADLPPAALRSCCRE